MTSRDNFKAKIKAGKILEALAQAMSKAVELEITTWVADENLGENAQQKPNKPGESLRTRINFLEGKIENEVGDQFLGNSPYAELKEFHQEQVQESHHIINNNLNSLQKLFAVLVKMQQANLLPRTVELDLSKLQALQTPIPSETFTNEKKLPENITGEKSLLTGEEPILEEQLIADDLPTIIEHEVKADIPGENLTVSETQTEGINPLAVAAGAAGIGIAAVGIGNLMQSNEQEEQEEKTEFASSLADLEIPDEFETDFPEIQQTPAENLAVSDTQSEGINPLAVAAGAAGIGIAAVGLGNLMQSEEKTEFSSSSLADFDIPNESEEEIEILPELVVDNTDDPFLSFASDDTLETEDLDGVNFAQEIIATDQEQTQIENATNITTETLIQSDELGLFAGETMLAESSDLLSESNPFGDIDIPTIGKPASDFDEIAESDESLLSLSFEEPFPSVENLENVEDVATQFAPLETPTSEIIEIPELEIGIDESLSDFATEQNFDDPFAIPTNEDTTDPFGGLETSGISDDPFAIPTNDDTTDDPFAIPTNEDTTDDPFAIPTNEDTTDDPFAIPTNEDTTDPFGGLETSGISDDPFGSSESLGMSGIELDEPLPDLSGEQDLGELNFDDSFGGLEEIPDLKIEDNFPDFNLDESSTTGNSDPWAEMTNEQSGTLEGMNFDDLSMEEGSDPFSINIDENNPLSFEEDWQEMSLDELEPYPPLDNSLDTNIKNNNELDSFPELDLMSFDSDIDNNPGLNINANPFDEMMSNEDLFNFGSSENANINDFGDDIGDIFGEESMGLDLPKSGDKQTDSLFDFDLDSPEQNAASFDIDDDFAMFENDDPFGLTSTDDKKSTK